MFGDEFIRAFTMGKVPNLIAEENCDIIDLLIWKAWFGAAPAPKTPPVVKEVKNV